MKQLKFVCLAITAAALAACGGGEDKVKFSSVISFGDSVSDAGAYKVGTVAAVGGGKFTVNGADGLTWTEVMAIKLKTPPQCAAQTGLLANNGVAGAPVTNFANCFNYAQGSSRVTAVGSGPNGVALQAAPFNQVNLGLIADSIQNQFTRHLAKIKEYKETQLVTVNAGGNDFFMQLGAVGAAAGGGAAAAGAATIAGWSPGVVATVSAGGATAVAAASQAAVTAMGQAGTELGTYIKKLVVDKGAKHVLVRNLGDLNITPFGLTFDANTKGLSDAMTQTFNAQLKAALGRAEGVVIMDDYVRSQGIAADPAAAGYSNVTDVACGPNAFSSPSTAPGSSLVCNAGNLIAGDTSKYAFADSVHPTPFAHRDAADYALKLLRLAGRDF